MVRSHARRRSASVAGTKNTVTLGARFPARSQRLVSYAVLVGAVVTLTAAAPARGLPDAARQAGPSAAQSDEWWFSSWDIRSKVWPFSRGAGVTVGLVDSGVQANLPDLRGAVLSGGNTIGIDNNGQGDGQAPTGHGTGLAALIAGQGKDGGILGIAPAAKILPILVSVGEGVGKHAESSGWGSGSIQEVSAGIRMAVNDGAQVVNLSLAGQAPSASACTPVLQDAVAYALQHNVVVVASAGNFDTVGNQAEEPASCAGVLGVGAVGPNLQVWADSERQPYVAVSAPGAEIAFLTAVDTTIISSGTSEAAAFVSGVAALIRSRYPSMPWYTVVQRIINTGLPEGGPVPNDSYGYGIVRIPRALSAGRYPVPATAPNPVYAAYQRWLASPAGAQFLTASRPHSKPRSPSAHKLRRPLATSSSGNRGVLAVIFAAFAVVVAGAVMLSVFVVRRRRRTT
jgi:membrane-anchored mycosin MYCP